MTPAIPRIDACSFFPEIPPSTRLAIIVPTARWTPTARAVLASLVGVASDTVAVLVADNSENPDKHAFLAQLRGINPWLLPVAHVRNVGVKTNILYLMDWCRDVEFVAQMADDDWMSPGYHADALNALLAHPEATCAEAGNTLVDIGDGRLVNVSQASMTGPNARTRMARWRGEVARVTMYNTCRRKALDAAIAFYRATPLNGVTLVEDLWELNRLALGDFLHVNGHGCLVHYPAMGSREGDTAMRNFEGYFKEAGLKYPFIFFGGLSTAIQCALFLAGKGSPLPDVTQRMPCAQYIFDKLFRQAFMPQVATSDALDAAHQLFAAHPVALQGFVRYCTPAADQVRMFDAAMVRWFTEIIRVLESPALDVRDLLSNRFTEFVNFQLG